MRAPRHLVALVLAVIAVLCVFERSTPAQTSGSPRMRVVLSERTAGWGFRGIATAPSGEIWGVGFTRATDLPVTVDAAFRTNAGMDDVFLMRLRPDGSMVYASYLGGGHNDYPNAVAVDAAGYIYVTGYTASTNFPTTPGAFDRECGSGGGCVDEWGQTTDDVFVTKLTPDGRSIVFSTFLGGARRDYGNAIAADAQGRAHVVGDTFSPDMPVAGGGFRPAPSATPVDGFYARLSADGSRLEYASVVGGSSPDRARGVTVSASGDVFAVGWTSSADFPVARALQPTFRGSARYLSGGDGWLARFSDAGLEYSTFFGGAEDDWLTAVTSTAEGVYIGGHSNSCDYPSAARPPVDAYGCQMGLTVSKISLDGSTVLRSIALGTRGGASMESLITQAVAVDSAETLFLAGGGHSGLPTTEDAAQRDNALSPDVIFGVIPMAGAGPTTTPTYLTYFGGRASEEPFGLVLDGAGGAFLGGWVSPDVDFPIINPAPSPGGVDQATLFVHFAPPSAAPAPVPGEIVLRANDVTAIAGAWQRVPDPGAANGRRMWLPNVNAPKVDTPTASPANYFELQFDAEAGVPYHLWMRMRADDDHYFNDSLYVQFSDSIDGSGNPLWRIGTTSATTVIVEDCTGCGSERWGWNDNGYGTLGQHVIFASSGRHTIRIQEREDGVSVDQVVLSRSAYLTTAPGAPKNDTTVLAVWENSAPPPPPPPPTPTSRDDFDGDGKSDLVLQHADGRLLLWSMDGAERVGFQSFDPPQVGAHWRIVGTGDLNADGKPDLLWQDQIEGSIIVWLMDGSRRVGWTYLSPVSRVQDLAWKVVGVADINNDTKPDVLFRHEREGWLAAWLLDGTTVTDRVNLNPAVEAVAWSLVGNGDFNGDGKTDLLWQHTDGRLAAWLMDGLNRSSTASLTPAALMDPQWRIVATTDLDGDGKVDIVFQHPDGRLVMWAMEGTTRAASVMLNPDRVRDTNWKIAGPR